MIGLGSNRLTVCRRGGMSVTQAGKGGMEWLAGGRLPSWANPYLPYSKAAGEALVAQFPTQWPTIRDYGFAHPEIVGYMNAYAPEDAKIAYSLVPTIGYRYITSTGSQFIDTGYIVGSNYAVVKMKTTYNGDNGGANVFFGHSEPNNVRMAFWCGGGVSNLNVGSLNNQNLSFSPSSIVRKMIHWIANNGQATVSIEDLGTRTYSYGGTVQGTRSVYLMAYHEAGSTTWKTKMNLESFYLEDNGVAVREMYPFIRKINGVDVCGVIDVLSGTFYQNAGSGSFTISETSPS